MRPFQLICDLSHVDHINTLMPLRKTLCFALLRVLTIQCECFREMIAHFLPSKISNTSNSLSVWKLSKVMVTLYPFSTVTLQEHICRLG